MHGRGSMESTPERSKKSSGPEHIKRDNIIRHLLFCHDHNSLCYICYVTNFDLCGLGKGIPLCRRAPVEGIVFSGNADVDE